MVSIPLLFFWSISDLHVYSLWLLLGRSLSPLISLLILSIILSNVFDIGRVQYLKKIKWQCISQAQKNQWMSCRLKVWTIWPWDIKSHIWWVAEKTSHLAVAAANIGSLIHTRARTSKSAKLRRHRIDKGLVCVSTSAQNCRTIQLRKWSRRWTRRINMCLLIPLLWLWVSLKNWIFFWRFQITLIFLLFTNSTRKTVIADKTVDIWFGMSKQLVRVDLTILANMKTVSV